MEQFTPKSRESLSIDEVLGFKDELIQRMKDEYPKDFFPLQLLETIQDGKKIDYTVGSVRDCFFGLIDKKRYIQNDKVLEQLLRTFFTGFDTSLSLEEILDLMSQSENEFGSPKK